MSEDRNSELDDSDYLDPEYGLETDIHADYLPSVAKPLVERSALLDPPSLLKLNNKSKSLRRLLPKEKSDPPTS